MKRLLPLLLLAAGCISAGTTAPKPCQDEATDLVWRRYYGRHDKAPTVEWHTGSHLWDGGPTGFTYAGWKVVVADQTGGDVTDGRQDQTCFWFSVTAFAHEMMHERTFRETGDVDAFHWRGDWELADKASGALALENM